MYHFSKFFILKYVLTGSILLLLSGCGDNLQEDLNTSSTPDNNISAPKIILKGDSKMNLIIDDPFIDPGVESDFETITTVSDLNTSKEGTYTVTYTATNTKGETLSTQRTIIVQKVASPWTLLPIDTNIELGNEPNTLYYVDPRPEENGKNRALKIDYSAWTFDELHVEGNNPHSIDRAGNTENFYIRTQNSKSFDVVNFKDQTVKTVSLGDHKPRAIGAYNQKYNIQLLSAKDKPVIDIIDVNTDTVIKTVGDRHDYNASQLTSNAGAGSATGHGFWFDEDYFGLIDRVHSELLIYKVTKNTEGKLTFTRTQRCPTKTALHAVERVSDPFSRKDVVTFYGLGEGDITKSIPPFVMEFIFDPQQGTVKRESVVYLNESNKIIDGVKPTTHHAGITPDGKYLVVPVFDGKVYFIERKSMKITKIVEANLGAAHIEFSKPYHLAIITNHFSEELTFIDLETLKVVKRLAISHHKFDPENKHLLQPHFSYLGEKGRYFYTFATQDGIFLKIDLKTLEIVDELETGGAPEQAHS